MSERQPFNWRKVIFGVRTQILIWYVVLMSCSALVSVLIIRDRIFARLEERTERSLREEIEEFRRLSQDVNPETGQPFGKDDIDELFDIYLSRNVPSKGEFYVAVLDNRFYKASSNWLPKPFQLGSPLIAKWGKLSRPMQGEVDTSIGSIVYRAEPVQIEQEKGVLVVTRLIESAREERNAEVLIVIEAMLTVLVVASILAWLAAGRVLKPLRSLTKTARSITGSSLTRRIPVKGADEITELTVTFNEMLDRLETTFNNQRNFLNDVGHELRTPLTIIRGHLELMGSDPQEQQETLNLVFDEIECMNRLVADLLLLARAKQPDFLQLEYFDIKTFTEELYTKAKALSERNWQLSVENSGYIIADRQRLTQAVMNLAHNATQYTTCHDTIEIGSAKTRRSARFWVRDTGPGISLEDQKQIFDRFVRVSTNDRYPEGTGLGLSIVRAIAEAHRGRVKLSSQLGIGSTFTIIIPVKHPAEGRSKV